MQIIAHDPVMASEVARQTADRYYDEKYLPALLGYLDRNGHGPTRWKAAQRELPEARVYAELCRVAKQLVDEARSEGFDV